MILIFIIIFMISVYVLGYLLISDKNIIETSRGDVIVDTSNSSKLSESGVFWKTKDGWFLLGNAGSGVEKWNYTISNNLNSKKIQEIENCINTQNTKIKLSYKRYLLTPVRNGYRDQVQDCEIIENKDNTKEN